MDPDGRRIPRVRYPWMRREIMMALAALADDEYQRDFWLTGAQCEDPHLVVHILYDDCEVLPDPDKVVGAYLLPGREIDRLRHLGVLFDAVLDDHEIEPVQELIDDPRWPGVMQAAGQALLAMVDGWGFPGLPGIDPESDWPDA